MNKKLLFSLTTIILLSFSNISYSQTLDMEKLSSFEAYTRTGAVTISGTFTSNIGK